MIDYIATPGTLWVTSDGKEFRTEKEAQDYCKRDHIIRLVEAENAPYGEWSNADVVEFILKHFG